MHLLTATSLEPLISRGARLKVHPFEPAMLQHTCYYLRLGERLEVKQGDKWVRRKFASDGTLQLGPRSFARVWTHEALTLSSSILGIFGQISDLIEQGLMLVHSPYVDPLFQGPLRLGLYNVMDEAVTIATHQPLAKISFFDVEESKVDAPAKGSIMEAKLQAFRRYVEAMDVSPFPPESLDDDE